MKNEKRFFNGIDLNLTTNLKELYPNKTGEYKGLFDARMREEDELRDSIKELRNSLVNPTVEQIGKKIGDFNRRFTGTERPPYVYVLGLSKTGSGIVIRILASLDAKSLTANYVIMKKGEEVL